jgi:hypothetical protein
MRYKRIISSEEVVEPTPEVVSPPEETVDPLDLLQDALTYLEASKETLVNTKFVELVDEIVVNDFIGSVLATIEDITDFINDKSQGEEEEE